MPQTVRSAAQKEALQARKKKRTQQAKKTKSKLRGRPPGSRNKDKNELKLSGELVRINELLAALLKLIRVFVRVKYVALDGHFGPPQAVLLARGTARQLSHAATLVCDRGAVAGTAGAVFPAAFMAARPRV